MSKNKGRGGAVVRKGGKNKKTRKQRKNEVWKRRMIKENK